MNHDQNYDDDGGFNVTWTPCGRVLNSGVGKQLK